MFPPKVAKVVERNYDVAGHRHTDDVSCSKRTDIVAVFTATLSISQPACFGSRQSR